MNVPLIPYLVQIVQKYQPNIHYPHHQNLYCLAESPEMAMEMASVCGNDRRKVHCFQLPLPPHSGERFVYIAEYLLTHQHKGYFDMKETRFAPDDQHTLNITEPFVPYLTRQEKIASLTQ